MGKAILVIVGLVGAFLAGTYFRVFWIEGWSVTTAALGAITALLLIVFAFAAGQKVQDGDPMPEAQRRFLALYLVAISVVLVYLVFALMSVRFPDLEATAPQTAPTLPDTSRPNDGAVTIAQLIPNPIRSDLGPIDLQIFGYNFIAPKPAAAPAATGKAAPQGSTSGAPAGDNQSGGRGAAQGTGASAGQASGGTAASPAVPTVIFRGSVKTPKVVTDKMLIVSLTAEDLSLPGAADVSVTGLNGQSASTKVRVLDVTGELRILRWKLQVTRETQLLLLVVVAGALGSYVHAIRSLTAYIGNQQAVASWFWFYITTPFVGVALAVTFYAAIRGGFVAGSPADAKSVNPFGVFAIAALVGMFADKAGNKLAEIFDALFRSESPRKNPISNLAITTAGLPTGKVATAYSGTVAAAGGGAPYTFSLVNPPAWLTINSATGALSGTPPAEKTETVGVSVIDANTSRTSKTYTFKVEP